MIRTFQNINIIITVGISHGGSFGWASTTLSLTDLLIWMLSSISSFEFKNTDFLNWFKFPCTCQAESKPMHRPNARAHSLVRLSGVEARFCSMTELLEGWGTSTPLSVTEGCVEWVTSDYLICQVERRWSTVLEPGSRNAKKPSAECANGFGTITKISRSKYESSNTIQSSLLSFQV